MRMLMVGQSSDELGYRDALASNIGLFFFCFCKHLYNKYTIL